MRSSYFQSALVSLAHDSALNAGVLRRRTFAVRFRIFSTGYRYARVALNESRLEALAYALDIAAR